ncbi:MAG: hypothetical protein JST52_04910 [Bacteroidetes bacterium]|nr:hypothetical protein [Bacteroidota bacterium]MBS1740857.1 hypothetical protein [Bacteroidota bacterium]MBS1777089.1 hypothetical protein [Bacteroidota bacterium]
MNYSNKILSVILVIVSFACITFKAQAQNNTVAITAINQNRLQFKVNSEKNILYYLLEQSQANGEFEIVDRVKSVGNTMLPHTYYFPMTQYSAGTFRVRQVDMNQNIAYSQSVKYENLIEKPSNWKMEPTITKR